MGSVTGESDAPQDAPIMGVSGGHQIPPMMPPMLFFDNLVKKLINLKH